MYWGGGGLWEVGLWLARTAPQQGILWQNQLPEEGEHLPGHWSCPRTLEEHGLRVLANLETLAQCSDFRNSPQRPVIPRLRCGWPQVKGSSFSHWGAVPEK